MATRQKRAANREGRMSLGQHLLELRKRLFISALAIVVATVGGYFLAPFVIDAMRVPISQIAKDRNATIVYTTVTGSFELQIQIAVTIAIIVASPVWLYQIFAFLVPGLTHREKKFTFGFLFSAIPLFLAGAASGWFLFPHMVTLLAGFSSNQDATFLDALTYYDFVIKLVLVVGVMFILPVFLVLLNFVGVLSAKAILKGWRVAILTIVLFTAIATPAVDVISMFLLAIPMILLYFGALGIAWWHDRGIARRAELLEAELSSEGA